MATSSSGTADGTDGTFTVGLPPAPAVVTGSPMAVTRRAAAVGGTITPNGAATTYFFQFGTTTSYGSQTLTRRAGAGRNAVSVAARLTGPSPGTLYHYRLVAMNASGTLAGADQSLTTAPAAIKRRR